MVMGAARRVASVLQQASQLRQRQPPMIPTGPDTGEAPTIYYLCPDFARPSGGLRNIYRHVDVLNAAGISATILHHQRGFRCRWFANDTRVVAAADALVTRADVLVIPEWYGPGLHQLPPDVRKVIFNQNAYRTFDAVPFDTSEYGAPYSSIPNLLGILTVSENNEALLRHAFPRVPVSRARVVVDGTVFHPATVPAGQRIAFLPRRRRIDLEQVLHILRARGAFTGWELVPINGVSEAETAQLMRDCAIFLSFSEREGFGLPPAEAMASGCYVVGFTGLAGQEFFDPQHSVPVPEGDVLCFVERVEQAIQAFETSPTAVHKLGQLASQRILDHYTEAGLRADLLDFFAVLI